MAFNEQSFAMSPNSVLFPVAFTTVSTQHFDDDFDVIGL
jgi:hypothetical protein